MKNTPSILANLPIGSGGYNSNLNSFRIPISQLVRATNIRYDNQAINKSFGIGAEGAAIAGDPVCLGGTSWYPTIGVERSITGWDDGHIYKEVSNAFGSVDLGSLGTIASPVVFVPFTNLAEAGVPVANRVSIWSKGCVPKQLVADAATFSALTAVSADWATSGPSGAFYHDFRQIAFGVTDYPHNIYFSTLTNTVDFTGVGSKVMSVFPGEGDKIVAGMSYLDTVAVVGKYPRGIYLVDTTDLTLPVNPSYRVSNTMGMAGPNAITKVNGDIWFVSDQGRLYSLTQLRSDIDPVTADITNSLSLTEFIKRNVDLTRVEYSVLHFDSLRQEIWYCFSGIGGTDVNDTAIVIKLGENGSPALVSIDTRGEFYNAMWSRRDSSGKQEVLSAGGLGQVVSVNNPNVNVLGDPFTATFSHPATDFSYLDPSFASREKSFKFLQVQIIPTGDLADIVVDVIVDGNLRDTITINLDSGTSSTYGALTSIYGTTTYGGIDYVFHQVPLDVTGTKIQFVWYNAEANEEFIIVDANVQFDIIGSIYEDR